MFAGLLLLAVAFAHFLRQVTRDLEPGGLAGGLIDLLTLQFLPFALRGFAGRIARGRSWSSSVHIGSLHVLTDPLRSADPDQPLVEVIYQKRFLARGPRIVAIGGGTGLSTLLRGLKEHTSNLTAIVTVADDGGSSGVLRAGLGIPPVGDIRNCIAALADAEPLMSERPPIPLPGDAAGRPMRQRPGRARRRQPADRGDDRGRGRRLRGRRPADEPDPRGPRPGRAGVARRRSTLHARLGDGTVVDGQSQIMRTAGIERVWLTPEVSRRPRTRSPRSPTPNSSSSGPGSLYTSLLPSLLIPAIRDAVLAASAPRIFVCNVATQAGETTGYDLARPRRGARRAHRARARRRRPRQQPARRRGRTRAAGQGRPAALAADGSGPPPRLILDDVVDPDEPASPRSGPPRGRAHPRARARDRSPPPERRRRRTA